LDGSRYGTKRQRLRRAKRALRERHSARRSTLYLTTATASISIRRRGSIRAETSTIEEAG
jgi:hypothetical protein